MRGHAAELAAQLRIGWRGPCSRIAVLDALASGPVTYRNGIVHCGLSQRSGRKSGLCGK